MQYSDTTNKNGLLQHCEQLTGLGDGGITGNATLKAQFTGALNRYYQQVVSEILNSQDDWDFDDNNHADQSNGTFPLVASQRAYTLPLTEKILRIKRLDVCWSGTGNTCYRAEPIDSGTISVGMGNDTELDSHFTRESPRFDVKGNNIFLYPRATADDVTNGGLIYFEWTREIDEFTIADTIQEPGIDEPWHYLISTGASMEFAILNDNPRQKSLKVLYDEGIQKMRTYYGRKNEGRDYRLKAGYIDYE